jgi:gluconolactonase
MVALPAHVDRACHMPLHHPRHGPGFSGGARGHGRRLGDHRGNGARIERIDPDNGTVEILYTHAGQRRLTAPNDIVLDDGGGFWFTDLGKDDGVARRHGAICYGRLDGSGAETVVFPCFAPNGIGLSPDGRTLYAAETFTGRLIAYEVQGPGALVPTHSFYPGRQIGASPGRSCLDSLAVEANGYVCVGGLLIGEILVFAPQGGIVERISVPDPLPTNGCFGGPELRTAYITLSHTGRLIAMEWPRPGLALPHQRA